MDETIAWLLWYNQHATALDAGLRQPDAVRAKLACGSAQASQFMTSAMGYGFQGQGHGADPRKEEKAAKAVITFDAFFEQHYFPHVKPRKRSYSRDEELYRLRIKGALGHRRL